MKIVHVCLCCFYVPGFAYQENIMSREHKKLGNDVAIITSQYEFDGSGERKERPVGKFLNEDDIPVYVLPYAKTKAGVILHKYPGFYEKLEELQPDIICCHGITSYIVKDIIKYKKKHSNVKLYGDQHADYYNTGWYKKRSFVRKIKFRAFYKVFLSRYARMYSKYVERIWGTTPWRCDFVKRIYGVNPSKVELLVMGGEDDKIHFDRAAEIRHDIRAGLGIGDDAFVLVTGGKIDRAKNIHLLMQAVAELNNDNIKLIVFGQPKDDMKEIVEKYSKDKNIFCIGWIESDKAYDYFLASDLAVFPGTHSVLWEQACACGIPGLFKDWEGMRHVDLGGNAEFLYEDSVDEIKEKISEIYNDKEKYARMKKVAEEKGIKTFSYREISKRAIELI